MVYSLHDGRTFNEIKEAMERLRRKSAGAQSPDPSSKPNKNLGLGLRPRPLPDKKHTMNFDHIENLKCEIQGNYRRCEDGQCIPEIDLCPEEQLMNQNTILIMIVVGLAVVIFLIVLYCFQQRQRHRHGRYRSTTLGEEEVSADRVSLFLPPPTYEEVITTNLYPPTPEMQLRQQHGQERINSFDEPSPITPPPTYHTALAILARSHESVLQSKLTVPTRRLSSSRVTRRSVSMDHLGSNRPQTQNSNSDICEQLEDDVFTKTCDDSNVTSINR